MKRLFNNFLKVVNSIENRHRMSFRRWGMSILTSKSAWFAICVLMIISAKAQVEDAKDNKKFHRLTLVMGHTNVPTGLDLAGKKKWLSLASWGLDYDYWFSEKWAAGLHTDVVLQNFKVEVPVSLEPNKILQRSTPVSLVPTAIYKPIERLSVLAGVGAEVSKEETLALLRIGADVGWEINEKYEVSFSFVSDFKLEAYSSFTLGIGVSRIFR